MKLKFIELEKERLEIIYKEENNNLHSTKLLKQSRKIDSLIIKEMNRQLQEKEKED